MIRGLTALIGLFALLSIMGCGNKGPLYLPVPPADPADETETGKPE